MTHSSEPPPPSPPGPSDGSHRRRPRYRGTHPRRYEEKYKEHEPARYAGTVAKVIASGKTPAGTHRPILVAEILTVLEPKPGERAVDCTLGYGGHAEALLPHLDPGGQLIGIDADPIELQRAETRLRSLGFGPDRFRARRTNFAGLPKILADEEWEGADIILADLGLSSMQIDNPARGFSVKHEGPLDMRLNPARGRPASALLAGLKEAALAELLEENSDEPRAVELARRLAGREFLTTTALANGIRSALPRLGVEESDLTIRRVFQALRIEVNDEFSALETFLRNLPGCMKPGGRAAVLTFHSGEDRRVKKAFAAGLQSGAYQSISREIVRPAAEERHSNPRSAPAKLRWARRAG